jgi:hypothetical protein
MTPAQQPYVRRVLDLLTAVRAGHDGWVARCPVTSHGGGKGDGDPSLRLTVGEAGRILLVCRGGCRTGDVLAAMGLGWEQLFPGDGEEPQGPLCLEPQDAPPAADLADRHAVYDHLLRHLPLANAHRLHLRKRGLKDSVIDRNGYASLSGANTLLNALKAVRGRFSLGTLLATPGLCPCPGPLGVRLSVEHPGVLVPCRDLDGSVRAVKLRALGPDVDAGRHPRYLYLSGGESGNSSGAWPHAPLGVPDRLAEAFLTEGELKADVVTALTGRYTVSCPGVAMAGRAVPLLERLPGRPNRVQVAFDWPDVLARANVRQAMVRAVQQLGAAGFAAGVVHWPPGDGKGLDDVAAAGKAFTVAEGDGVPPLLEHVREAALAAADTPTTTAPATTPEGNGRPAPPAPPSRWPRAGRWRPPAFPCDVLPAPLAGYVRTVAAAKQCPPDFAGLALLTAAGAMAGTTHELEVCPGWSVFPCLYGVIVAPPGQRKTPALKAVLRPLYDRQAEAAAAVKSGGLAADEMPHYYLQDCTVEAVVALLSRFPRGTLLVREEITGWVASENQYRQGRGADRQFWLSVWSSEPVKNDRKLSAPALVGEPFVCVLGGIQPDKLGDLAPPGGRDDGFSHRLLFACPDPLPPAKWGGPQLDDAACRPWHDAAAVLLACDRPDGARPLAVRFDAGGLAAWAAWYDGHAAAQADASMPAAMAGPWSKMTSYCPRFALTLCLLDAACDGSLGRLPLAVGEDHVERSAELVDYFASHAHGVHQAMSASPADPLAARAVSLAAASPGGVLTAREAMRRLQLPTRSAAMAVLRRAEDLGRGEVIKHATPGRRPSDALRVLAGEEDEG